MKKALLALVIVGLLVGCNRHTEQVYLSSNHWIVTIDNGTKFKECVVNNNTRLANDARPSVCKEISEQAYQDIKTRYVDEIIRNQGMSKSVTVTSAVEQVEVVDKPETDK